MRIRDRRARAETLIRIQQERIPHLFVGGLEVESEGNATIVVVNPATQEQIGRCPAANVRDIEKAVESAQRAHRDEWRRTQPDERMRLLWALADAIENDIEDLAILESLQTGKTFREVLDQDLRFGVRVLRYFAGAASRESGESHTLSDGTLGYVRRAPHPVVGVVVPWTEPIGATLRKIAPALAAGSTVLVKPPERAPLTVLRLGELMREVGFPAGVYNVVPGFDDQASEALANSMGVDALFFSGTVETARRVQLGAAKSNLKPVHCELGGKGVIVIFDDADARAAIRDTWKSIFTSRSVLNTAGARILVQSSVYEEVAQTLASRAKEILVGDQLDEHTELGPMIDEDHMKRVLKYVELGRREGAKLVAGGGRDVDGAKSDGWFVQPTLFVDTKKSMRIVQEQIGGPVLTMSAFTKEEAAIDLANDSQYGMTAGVFTADLARAHRVAEQLQVGVIWVNHYGGFSPVLPRGGVRFSGVGRDLGGEALGRYTFSKSVYVPTR